MAQIGSFTRGENGVYTGEIRTLTLKVKATIRPVEREHEKSPDYRVSAGAVEFGAGWTKKQPDGQVHPEEAAQLILGFLRASGASLGSSKSLVDQGGARERRRLSEPQARRSIVPGADLRDAD